MTSPRKIIAAFLIVISTLICACKSAETVNPIPANHVVLQPGKSSVTPVGIIVFADTVNLSICPKNASCLVADNLSASVRLVRNQESQRVRLFAWFGDWGGDVSTKRYDSTSIRLGGQLYKVILKGEYIGEDDKGRIGRALLQVAPLN